MSAQFDPNELRRLYESWETDEIVARLNNKELLPEAEDIAREVLLGRGVASASENDSDKAGEANPEGTPNAIWNPEAAAAWSLLFTPAFGSYLHMLNWKTLENPGKAATAFNWFVVSIVIYATMLLFPQSTFGKFGFLFFIVWYFSFGWQQRYYIVKNYGSNYPRKPWAKALLIALAITLVAVIIITASRVLFSQATLT